MDRSILVQLMVSSHLFQMAGKLGSHYSASTSRLLKQESHNFHLFKGQKREKQTESPTEIFHVFTDHLASSDPAIVLGAG